MALRGLDGKVAIVTGGGSGMGAATSARLADEGVKVVVVDVREDAAKETAAGLPGDAIAVGADVSTVDGVDRYVQATVDAFGRVDLFHNNAGYGGDLVPIWDTTVEQFDYTISVNTRGVFLGLRAVLGQMLRQHAAGSWSGARSSRPRRCRASGASPARPRTARPSTRRSGSRRSPRSTRRRWACASTRSARASSTPRCCRA